MMVLSKRMLKEESSLHSEEDIEASSDGIKEGIYEKMTELSLRDAKSWLCWRRWSIEARSLMEESVLSEVRFVVG